MSKRAWIFALSFGLLGLLIGRAAMGIRDGMVGTGATHYVPPLKVVGDVADIVTFRDPKEIGKLTEITFQGTKYQAGRLADIIAQAKPMGKATQLYLLSSDGFSSAIKAKDIEDCYISFTANNGWEAVNLKHPINSNVKLLQEIIVVSDGNAQDFGFRVINPNANLVQTTPGQLEVQSLREYSYLEGRAEIQHNGQTYESSVYTRRRVFQLGDLTPVNNEDMLMVIGAKGQNRLVSQAWFQVKDNSINYWQPEERSTLENVRGVVINLPGASVMDTYSDALHYLQNEEKVLVIVVDGLTFHQYSTAAADGMTPFLQKAGLVQKALGVYPLGTNVGFAALLTGKTPEENGVITANDQMLLAPSLFAAAKKLNKSTLLIEPVQTLLNLEVQPLISKDQNDSGSADDEVSALTLANLDKGHDLITVRFHAVAASAQQYGEAAQQTLAAVRETDKYIADIAAAWKGRIIITADQAASFAGSSTNISCDNMFVPYLLISK